MNYRQPLMALDLISFTAFYDVLFAGHKEPQDDINEYEQDILQKVDNIINDSYNLSRHIPILSDVFTDLWAEINCEHTDFQIIASILKRDPILKAKLLMLVNSAYYKRTKNEVTEVERAIGMIGLETISAIFVTFMVRDMMKLNPVHFKLFGKMAWQHLLETAVVSQQLSKDFGAPNRFLCYLMGLVHDLGKVIIFTAMSDQWLEQIQLNHLGSMAFKFELTERSLSLSRYTVEDWHLPDELIHAISHYHHEQHDDPYSKVLHMANRVSELHLQTQVNRLNIEGAHELLMESGLTWQQSCSCLEAVNNMPPL